VKSKAEIGSKTNLREIVKIIVRDYGPVEKIFLFGSAARGETDEYSDLDLIIIKKTSDRFVKRLGDVPSLPVHADEIHPHYGKPWKDMHNIFQWGITDEDIRTTMRKLGFQEVFFHNYGQFSHLVAFENHAFIFVCT